ncbi:Putative glycosyltransferases [Achromobacter xylosoxidans]|jgi:putative glycosyltransferase|uniref:glycosyltransferase family 2 protein n=1 Tax=Alcaligenes xylosoxydans xylosoxydans TaxID=85698 RepID=UPI0006C5D2FB|nr:glycosyltransferase family 2 protein [Achromobacter xylosoxidans]ELQ7838909.1 glycosyltransferase family 2 protein [Pseudomonas aeruginosa]PNM91666.1 glycosyltransferase [Achromobacter xylosoxidans]CUJ03616.1 Putative glycosyltransferases [Achromobacter xylosoxidans]
MKLSVVTTIYKTSAQIHEFFARAVEAADRIGATAEVIFVNDGSPDDGLEVGRELAGADHRAVIVDLAANVGQHRALWTGMRFATGDYIGIMDGDLEEDPLWLVNFFQFMTSSGSDVAYGVQKAKKGGLLYRACRHVFYSAIKMFTSASFPRNVVTARLMTRQYLTALLEYDEREIFLVGMMHMVGFKQMPVEVDKIALSPTSYSLGKLIRIFVTHTTSFSITPLLGVFIAGLAILGLSVLCLLTLLILHMTGSIAVPGWASTMAAFALFSGISIFFNGIIAIYIGTIFLEVKRRPLATVRALYKQPSATPSPLSSDHGQHPG